MSESVWQLAGPRRFVGFAVRDLQEGSSVILLLPPHVPDGLATELRRSLAENDRYRWVVPDSEELDFSSVLNLAASLRGRYFRGSTDTMEEIDGLAKAMRHSVVFVTTTDATCWCRWRELIDRFRVAASAIDECDRGCFCVTLAAGLREGKGDVGLVVHPWRGVVSVLDTWRWADQWVGQELSSWIERSLVCSIVVELAGYDLELARFLASLPLSELCAPTAQLKEFSSSRSKAKWTKDSAWEFGSVDEWRGPRFVHSGWLAMRDREPDITRRVWQGQLSVLFPYLERCRVHLLSTWTRSLSLPVETPDGVVHCAEDLELGQLAFHLHGRLPREEWQCLAKLRDWRHELAHVRPIYELSFAGLPVV